MAKYTLTLAADTTSNGVYLATCHRRRSDATFYGAEVIFSGTFGSGTVTLYLSPDHGVTVVPLLNAAGTAISATAAKMQSIELRGNGSKNGDDLEVWAQLAGSSSPSLTISYYDNK